MTDNPDLSHLTPLERLLYDALEAASNHLDYCGYGDSWESECAHSEKLPDKIMDALDTANGTKAKREVDTAMDLHLEPFRVHAEKYQTRVPLTKRQKRKLALEREHRAITSEDVSERSWWNGNDADIF